MMAGDRHNDSARGAFHHQAGFTLIEVIIALGIFVLIGAGCYQVLSTLSRSQELVDRQTQEFGELLKGMHILSSDLQQPINRKILPERDDKADFAVTTHNEDYLLELTRAGFRNPMLLNRSELQRVAYALGEKPEVADFIEDDYEEAEEGLYLLRYSWKVLDRGADAEPVVQVLLPRIETLSFRFMDEEGEWYEEWPPVNRSRVRAVPSAIEIELESLRFGRIKRLFDTGNLEP